MMMGGVTLETVQGSLDLLRLLAKPDAAAAMLSDIEAKWAAINEKEAALIQRDADQATQAASLSKRESALSLAMSGFNTDKAATETALTARAGDLAVQVAVFEADSKAQGQKLARDTDAVRGRERDVEIRESRAQAREDAVAEREAAIVGRESAADAKAQQAADTIEGLRAKLPPRT